jgi:hypothetical protein
MNPREVAYLVTRDFWQKDREQRYRAAIEAATSEDTEPEGLEVSFLREPHAKLYPPAWENERMRTECKQALKNHVLNAIELEFQQPDKFIYFTVYGGGASYNWDEQGDFDVQMWVDIDKFNELHEDQHDLSQDDLVADIRRIVGPINFPTFADLNVTTDDEEGGEGKMMIQFYPKPGTGAKSENLAQQPYACYDIESDEWLVRPKPLRPTFYGELFLLVEPKAEDVAVQAEAALDELQRNITDWQFWYSMWRRYKNPKYKEKFENSRDNAEQFKETVKTLFEGVFGGRAEAYSPEGKGIEDERDVLQKQLEVWGIFQRLKHWARQPLPWDEQELPSDEESGNDDTDAETDEKESKVNHISTLSGWDRIVKRSDWNEIMENARQLRDAGAVNILNYMIDPDSGQVHTIANVQSQTTPGEVYETEIWQDEPGKQSITLWSCDCDWGQHSWGRTRQWQKYEGRPCKHTLAVYWATQGMQPQENGPVNTPQQPAQPQMGQTPQDWVQQTPTIPTSPVTQNAPTPGGPNLPTVLTPPVDQEAQPTPVEQPSFSQPKDKPDGTISFPGTFSHWHRTSSFDNGEIVRNSVPVEGYDRDQVKYVIPRNSSGEVLWSDEQTTIVMFPLKQNGPLESHLVRAEGSTSDFYRSPSFNPGTRRRR